MLLSVPEPLLSHGNQPHDLCISSTMLCQWCSGGRGYLLVTFDPSESKHEHTYTHTHTPCHTLVIRRSMRLTVTAWETGHCVVCLCTLQHCRHSHNKVKGLNYRRAFGAWMRTEADGIRHGGGFPCCQPACEAGGLGRWPRAEAFQS